MNKLCSVILFYFKRFIHFNPLMSKSDNHSRFRIVGVSKVSSVTTDSSTDDVHPLGDLVATGDPLPRQNNKKDTIS